jgi:pre-rRNA-processing protein TSR1
MMAVENDNTPLSAPTAAADDLTATNEVDMMANEQTWPTEDEMASAPGSSMGDSKRTKRVPKGTSAYQAAWIVDDNDGEDDDEDDEDEDDMDMEDGEGGDVDEELLDDNEETEEIELDTRTEAAHDDLNAEDEERQYVHPYLVQIKS